jgi:hypothetical protein
MKGTNMDKIEIKQWTPTLLETDTFDHAILLAHQVKLCPICAAYMIDKFRDTRTVAMGTSLKEQIERAGIHYISASRDEEGNLICDVCAHAGRATFRCDLCQVVRDTDKIEEVFGDPPSYLCSVCFETVSAKTWEKACESLHERHRYDFER